MFSARAAITAARSRAFMPGSGNPSLAATVISRASLPNSLDLAASCRPLRCMMFLNCECPAMVVSNGVRPARRQGAARANPVKRDAGVIFRRAPEWKPSPERRPRLFESTAETYRSDTARETGRIVGFDRDRAQRRRPQRRFEATRRDSAHETVERLVLAHPDHGIVVAGHADIGDERGAARQDLVVGGRRVGMGADDQTDAAVAKVPHGLLLARRLAMDIDHDGIGVAPERAGSD